MRLMFFRRAVLALAAGLLLPAAGSAQIPAGQTDNFEDNTTKNWQNGGLNGTGGVTVQLGGPAGPNDHYLQVLSGQVNAPPKLIIFNRAQWTGNYNTNAIGSIEMDVINFSSTVLALRVGFKEDATSLSGGYVSSNAITLPVESQPTWHHVSFPLTDAAMTAVNSPSETFHELLGSAARPTGPGEVRILSSQLPSFNGDTITNGRLGIDNIRAVAAPVLEPAGGLALLLAAAGVVGRRALRRRRVTA